MANVVINLGDSAVNLSSTSDLAKFAEDQLSTTTFKIAQSDILRFKNQTLSEIPSESNNPISAGLKVAQDAKWKIGGSGNLTVGFSAGAQGTIKILKSGDLFSYSVDNESKNDIKVAIPEGFAYVVINLKVSFGLTAGAGFSNGNFGVKGGVDASAQFNLTNYKCFPVNTKVEDAVKAAFERFVLPFKAEGIKDKLINNDYVEYEFIGKLGLTFGVTYGLSSLFLGGRSIGEINESFDSPVGKLVVGVKPTFEAGAKLGISYDYSDAFRLVVGRHVDSHLETDKLALFLFKMNKSELGIDVSVGLTVGLGASFSIASKLDEIIDKAAKSLFSKMPDGALKDAAIAAFKANLNKEEHKRELDKYVKDANEQVASLLKKFDNQKLELQVLHERINTNTALFNYEFDLNVAAALTSGFKTAIEGNFQEALKTDGVFLLPGSYVENIFIRRTTLSFQFFDFFKLSSTTEYFKQVSTVYAGNGIFKMRYTVGVKYDEGFVGHERDAEIFFTAEVSTKTFQTVSDLDVKLHFILTDHANRKAARQTRGILEMVGGPVFLQQLTARLNSTLESDAALIVKLTCVLDKTAYGKLSSDEFITQGHHLKPQPLPQPHDQANWEAFVSAVDKLSAGGGYKGEGFPNFVSRFIDWVRYNRVANDSQESTMTPNRRSSGNLSTDSVWVDDWRQRDSSSDRVFMRTYMEAGRGFMNLVDDLKHLASDQDNIKTGDQYKDLVELLNAMVKNGNDIQAWFAKPTLLALLNLVKGTISNVKGPSEEQIVGHTFDISFDVSE